VKRNLNVLMVITLLFVLLIVNGNALTLVADQHNSSKSDIEGIWQGVLKTSGIELRIVFKISKKLDGTLTATLDSPDQGAKDIPVYEVTLENDSLRIDVKAVHGIYEGKVAADELTIDGKWKQSGMSIPLQLKKVDKAYEICRPQEPKEPFPYEEEEVLYENEVAGIKLAGTLTLPHSEGLFPAVLLISGSGAQDRNEMLFNHRPFLVLADYLTRRGIAVLRVDDRGVGGSTGNVSQATSEDFAGDVFAGIEYLKSRIEVNKKQIGLIGHSEGGVIAPMVAVQSTDVAFIVMMAGSVLTGEEILYLQAALINRAEGISEDKIARNRALQESLFTVIKKEKDSVAVEKQLREILMNSIAEMSEEEKDAMGDTEAIVESQITAIVSPWFRYFLEYDPRPILRKVTCPVLAINGEKDLQVPPKENLSAIEEALGVGGNENYTIRELPGLNHLFQTAQTGSTSEYGKIEETISPVVLKMIADWILEQIEIL